MYSFHAEKDISAEQYYIGIFEISRFQVSVSRSIVSETRNLRPETLLFVEYSSLTYDSKIKKPLEVYKPMIS